jgi:ATP-dependent Clp protease ATP-binding subunit ClpA
VALDDEILREARQARERLIAAQHDVDVVRGDYHHAIRALCAAGGSLREIAEALGLSHQRVHQIVEEETRPLWLRRGQLFARRGGFARFTRTARAVTAAARAEAHALGHDHVGTEHLILGLLTVEGIAADVLASLGIGPEAVRERAGRGPGSPSEKLPFAPGTKKLLEQALREALSLKHDYIGTEHLLLALADADVLRELGVDGERIRAEIHRQLAA